MVRHQAAEREKSVSVLASLLPFLSVLYSEFIFAYFAHMPITSVKVWMALGLGGIALALSRTTPLKGLNFLLLTVWTVGLWGFTFVQFLYRQMFGVCMGYEIKHGKLGRAIRDTTISGIAFDMLKTVDMLSDDMVWTCSGMCGKKQPMPVGMGGPAVKCKVNIGGR